MVFRRSQLLSYQTVELRFYNIITTINTIFLESRSLTLKLEHYHYPPTTTHVPIFGVKDFGSHSLDTSSSPERKKTLIYPSFRSQERRSIA